MVGKEATTGPPLKNRQRMMRDRSLAAALRWSLAIVLFAFYCVTGWTADPEPQSNKVLRASGETVHHWQVGETDAYLLVGNVIMLYGGERAPQPFLTASLR